MKRRRLLELTRVLSFVCLSRTSLSLYQPWESLQPRSHQPPLRQCLK